MDTTFDRFSRRAQRVLGLAEREARRLNHRHIEPEHLLLGMTRLEGGTAVALLAQAGVDLDQLRMRLEQLLGDSAKTTAGETVLGPRTKRVIAAAIVDADRSKRPTIGSQQLLLGLLLDGEGPAFELLSELGVRIENVRAEVPGRTSGSVPEE